MRSSTLVLLVSIAALGCAGDPDRSEAGDAELGPAVPRAVWQAATAGCEDTDGSDFALARVEGEPLLAALVDRDGHVECVDALSLLEVELGVDLGISPLAGDPSPQPAIQYLGSMQYTSGSAGPNPPRVVPPEPLPFDGHALLDEAPELVSETDPTPTPVTED